MTWQHLMGDRWKTEWPYFVPYLIGVGITIWIFYRYAC